MAISEARDEGKEDVTQKLVAFSDMIRSELSRLEAITGVCRTPKTDGLPCHYCYPYSTVPFPPLPLRPLAPRHSPEQANNNNSNFPSINRYSYPAKAKEGCCSALASPSPIPVHLRQHTTLSRVGLPLPPCRCTLDNIRPELWRLGQEVKRLSARLDR